MTVRITFGLSAKEIGEAIKAMSEAHSKVSTASGRITARLVEMGAARARQNVSELDAVDSGALQASIGGQASGSVGLIYADAPHAAFVEFGTGVVGAGKEGKSTPHPQAATMWKYDVNQHGEEGWVYSVSRVSETGEMSVFFRRTAGYISRPFMWNTKLYLDEIAPQVAKEVLEL